MTLEPADSAAQREPGDAGVTDDAHGAYETVRIARHVELPEQGTATGPSPSVGWIDGDLVHAAEVDDDAAVARGMPQRAVAAAANRDLEVEIPPELQRGGDVVDAGRPDDEGR